MPSSFNMPPSESSPPPRTPLQQGIRALRAGDRPRAREILTAVVTADEDNEQAWLWLSRAVDSDKERLICLENVLTLNPSNQHAQQALKELEARELAKRPPEPAQHASDPIYKSYSEMDDIWARAETLRLCPYCAAQIAAQEERCPSCERKLAVSFYQYDKASSNLHVYWVLILALSLLFAMQVGIDALTEQPTEMMITHGIMIPILLLLVPFLYLRHNWAHIASIVALFAAAVFIIAIPYIESAVSDIFLGTLLEPTPLFGLAEGVSAAITGAVRIAQLAGVALAAVFGLFIVPPDFARGTMHMVAQLNKKVTTSTGAFLEAERYAKRGMWAAAVLHYQKAVALDPTRLLYQLSLAQAYNQLNFFDRSMDVLQSAQKTVSTPEANAKIKELMVRVESKRRQTAVPQKS